MVWAVPGLAAAGILIVYMTLQIVRMKGREHRLRVIGNRLSERLERVILVYNGENRGLTPVVSNYEAVFGSQKREWEEQPETFKRFLCQQTGADIFDRMDRGIPDGVETYEFCYRTQELLEEQWLLLQIIYIGQGEDIQYFLSLENSTGMKQVQNTLKAAVQDAEQANRAKTFFLSRMSHEIRTPLNAIIGMQEIARNNLDDTQKVKACLDKVSASSAHLLGLINDILEISRIESGKIELAREPFRLPELVQSVYDMVLERAAKKGQALLLQADSLWDGMLMGDSMRIRQVILNILTNAVKYTQEGGRISFMAEQSKSSQPGYVHIVFEIDDTGIGMSEAFLNKLFDPFEMEGRGSAEEGTGLGMAITRNIVSMLGGTISVKSRKDHGTAVTVELELERADKNEQGEGNEVRIDMPPLEEVFRGKRVLLAEDNELNAEIIIELLSSLGAIVSRVCDGVQAVNSFTYSASRTFDLILMDIQMPVMDGYRASKAIRSSRNQDAAVIPIIALTADAFIEDIKRARDAGMNGHVSKPVDLQNLAVVVWNLTGEQHIPV